MADNGFFNYDKELNDPLVCRNGFETWKRLTQRLRYSISIGWLQFFVVVVVVMMMMMGFFFMLNSGYNFLDDDVGAQFGMRRIKCRWKEGNKRCKKRVKKEKEVWERERENTWSRNVFHVFIENDFQACRQSFQKQMKHLKYK